MLRSSLSVWLVTAACGLLVVLASPWARADRRIFAFTYPYMTLPQGGFELEHYLDAKLQELPDPGDPGGEAVLEPDWQHQVEAEYGITDHLDFGFYNVFRQKPFGDLRYRGVKLRSRYRFAERGELPLDLAVYLEGAYKGDEVEVEQRLIFAKSFGALEFAGNLKFEQESKRGEDELELACEPSLALGYHFSEALALGLEALAQAELEDGAAEELGAWVGPTLSVAGRHFWWTVTVQRRVLGEEELPEWQLRSLFAAIF